MDTLDTESVSSVENFFGHDATVMFFKTGPTLMFSEKPILLTMRLGSLHSAAVRETFGGEDSQDFFAALQQLKNSHRSTYNHLMNCSEPLRSRFTAFRKPGRCRARLTPADTDFDQSFMILDVFQSQEDIIQVGISLELAEQLAKTSKCEGSEKIYNLGESFGVGSGGEMSEVISELPDDVVEAIRTERQKHRDSRGERRV